MDEQSKEKIVYHDIPIAAMVWEIATQAATSTSWQKIHSRIFRLGTLSRGSAREINRSSWISCSALFTMPLDPIDPQPTMKKTPAKTADGIVWSTTSNGPVMVPMMAKPITK